jgi:hypothetical protein
VGLRLLAGATSAGLGWLGADQVTTNGPDLAGIALIITAISGMIATIGGLVIAFRRRPSDPNVELINAVADILDDRRHRDEP